MNQCDNCQLWKRGDTSKKNIGNVGLCTFMAPKTGGFYDHSRHVPFWAENFFCRTASYEGRDCGQHVLTVSAYKQRLKDEKETKKKARHK